jgi:RsiW-degrading membrane proteinase PrsW (M82 family)
MSSWQLLGVILASALLWMQYVDLKDARQPEPRKHLVIAFLLGIVAWAIAVLCYVTLEAFGVSDVKFGEPNWAAAFCFLVIGPVEEGAKFLVAYLIVFRWREFDEPIEGIVYAAAISLGFASVENFHNLPDLSWPSQLARTAALPITHTLFSAIWGFGIAYARFCVAPGPRRTLWQVGSIALGMFAHGLYDFLILAYQATFVTSGLALVIWVFVIWRARVCLKQSAVSTVLPVSEKPGPHPPTNPK